MDRREQILATVDAMLRVHADWEADDNAPVVPTQKLERAIDLCIETAKTGDVPADCRVLVAAIARLGVQWTRYQNGIQTDDYRPKDEFWDAFRGVRAARRGADVPVRQVRESVAFCRERKYDDMTIAKMYGSYNFEAQRWEGIFFSERGTPLHDLIEREAKNAGSVLGKDYVHPDDAAAEARSAEDLKTQLAALEEEETHEDTDPATVEEMLREGAFVHQIVRAKGVSRNEVLKIANELGLKANDQPNLASMRAPHEPEITPEQDAALRPREEQVQGTTLDDQVRELSEEGKTPLEIAQHLGITHQRVTKILHRQAEAVS